MRLASVILHRRKVTARLRSALPNAKRFAVIIEQQAAHHRTRTFREEYLQLLRRSGVEFDERYI